ncbi:hypothetical protein [Pelagibacterium halotolerans]|uniref:Uncharacterized protein n=1 Tax=Pelagibacterium halotolerans (strain DSM 22347 / JCM 15775 / CGMCC 1.7692 / B2) TaxID=1082931 RepID=G4RC80_PELHB|nr:hypothetical protein [Pelagibacterium halotolerans]AEQ52703.1 hypothetical protein KKY_2695 [Pelagibacterium halotolerans B2]QJR17594.1 hypothetical protein HKM20_03555 [Pelagibacterium halotolerans]SEA84728.1 hypothetical protein SAMN05428936_10998 [Pelagibacterium halotolerans]
MTDMSVIHLTDEARTILAAAFANDPACADMIVLPATWHESEGLVDLFITGVPAGRSTHSKGVWMPQRQDVVELVRRVINARSRHWDHTRLRSLPMPRDWWRAIRDEYAFIESIPECASGWCDLLIGMSGWLSEHYDGFWHTSQLKEKFGGLQVYHDAGDERTDEMVSVAEWLSEFICEDCGAPGRLRKRGQWYRTVCDAHAAEGGFE